VYRHGPKAVYVQQSDEFHFSGKGLCGKQGSRDRIIPPEHLIPVYNAGVRYLVQAIRAEHEVTEAELRNALGMCVYIVLRFWYTTCTGSNLYIYACL
jgi:hypothetical protein